MIATSQNVGAAITKALGLPKETKSVEISLVAGGILKVRVEHYADVTRINALTKAFDMLLTEYELVKRDKPIDPPPFDSDAEFEALMDRIRHNIDVRTRFPNY